MTSSLAAAFIAACSLLAYSGTAKAYDYKNFSTNVCVPVGAAASNDLSYSHQGMFNTSATEPRVVICPLLKDGDSSWTAGTVTVYAEYRAPGGQAGTVNCTAYVGSLTSGNYSAASSEPSTPAGSSGSISLALETNGGYVYEPVNLACGLGPRMRLTRIYLYENVVTDNNP